MKRVKINDDERVIFPGFYGITDDERVIFPGFYGITPSGHIATFSRGSSDITGAILARGLNADLYENFTDVDAIFSANPNIIDQPKPIKKMT